MPGIQCGEVEICYVRAGGGTPLLVIHGGEADKGMYADWPGLMGEGFEVISYDQRDTGGTLNPPQAYSVADQADDAARLVRALGHRRVHVFGTSYGGWVAQMLALRHGALVDRLVLAATTCGLRAAPLPADVGERFAQSVDGAGLIDSLGALYFSERSRDRFASLTARIESIKTVRTAEQSSRRMSSALAFDSEGTLSGISAKTLVLGGLDDRIATPQGLIAMAREIPDATVLLLGGLGHALTLEDPGRITSIVRDFLSGGLPLGTA